VRTRDGDYEDPTKMKTHGGMFMYSGIVNHSNAKRNQPQGKRHLMYELAVVAFMC
jgi:fructose-1,6-bisphosphatase